jgi:hypothetical protein
MANLFLGEAMANPSSGIQGMAGIRVALRHRPPPTQAPYLKRGARNPPRRARDKSPPRLTQARNQPRRRPEGVRRNPPPHQKPTSNLIRTVTFV